MTVGKALVEATDQLRAGGSESARLDAELLLGHVLGIDRTGVLAHPDALLGTGQLAAFEGLVERRVVGEPVAYIRGVKEFFGLSFGVDPRALIPRPETELLVELAIQRVTDALTRAPRPPGSPPLRVIDVGTGSGAVAIALAVSLRRRRALSEVTILATDRSTDALALALENAVAHAVADAIAIQSADLLSGEVLAGERFDLVVANLPYVPTDELPMLPVAASFEPAEALDGGPDGLSVTRRLMGQLPGAMAPTGAALLEIASGQAEMIREAAARELPGWEAMLHDDLAGRPRVVELRPPS